MILKVTSQSFQLASELTLNVKAILALFQLCAVGVNGNGKKISQSEARDNANYMIELNY